MRLSDEEKIQTGERSFEIIVDWGLDRFYEGIWQVMKFCTQVPANSYASPIIDRFILNLWKERYRLE